MSARIRVLHIIQSLNYGGMERLLADLVGAIDHVRFESHVLCLQYRGRFSEGLDTDATLHPCTRQSKVSLLWPRLLTKQIASIAPSVVHTHSGVWYKASLAARLAGVPRVIHTEHGRQVSDTRLGRLLDRLASRRTDVTVAVSNALAEDLERNVVHNSAMVRVVHNGVDTERHRPRPDDGNLRRQLGLARDTPILGSVGRLEPVKCYEAMIDALALLRADWSSSKAPVLVIVGDGSERAKLEERAREQELSGAVHFIGWRDDVPSLYTAFSLFTLSSLSEGTSISLLEAMNSGLCPVLTDVGGNRDVLGPELSHRLVSSNSSQALARAWRSALADTARRVGDGQLASRRVERYFSLTRMVRRYEALYSACGQDQMRAQNVEASAVHG